MTCLRALFGSVAGGNSKAEFNAKTNLLDFPRVDVKRLHGQVSGAERDKLQAHLKGYEDMSNRQSRLGEIEGTLRRVAPEVTDKFKSEVGIRSARRPVRSGGRHDWRIDSLHHHRLRGGQPLLQREVHRAWH